MSQRHCIAEPEMAPALTRRIAIHGRGAIMAATLCLCACASRPPAAPSPPPPHGWHAAYLVVNSVDYTTVYALRADGTYTAYRPNAVDGNEAPCTWREREKHDWCIDHGTLRFEAPDAVVLMRRGTVSETFHLRGDGKYCFVVAAEDEGAYDPTCEDDSRADALQFIDEVEHGLPDRDAQDQ
jgi:hypothetical protein